MIAKKIILLAALIAAIGACGTGRRSEPILGPLQLASNEQLEGQKLFMVHCNQCHPGGDAGLGPAVNDKPVPDAAIRLQVREGLGAMPSFPEELISTRELDQILDYMEALQDHG